MKNRLIDIFKRPVTTVLIVINAIVFLFTYSNENYYVYHGGLNYDLVIENGEWYRFITCMFLHSGFQHILMNVVSLAFCGFSLEDKIGSLRTGVIYFGSGLCGGVLSVVINWLMARSVISVGAPQVPFMDYLQHMPSIRHLRKANQSGKALVSLPFM